jgi:hypothetical protein
MPLGSACLLLIVLASAAFWLAIGFEVHDDFPARNIFSVAGPILAGCWLAAWLALFRDERKFAAIACLLLAPLSLGFMFNLMIG